VLFGSVRTLVLRSENAVNRSYWAFPVLIGITLVINIYFIIYKGAKGLDLDEISDEDATAWSFGLGLGITALITPPLFWFLKKKMAEYDAQQATKNNKTAGDDSHTIQMTYSSSPTISDIEDDGKSDDETEMSPSAAGKWTTTTLPPKDKEDIQEEEDPIDKKISATNRMMNYLRGEINKKPEDVVNSSQKVVDMYERAEKFDDRAEANFRYLQIFTAICDSFSHGANDVANAVGPFAAIYVTWRSGIVASKSDLGDDAIWMLAIGGVGIVLGLLLYGYKIMHALGVKLTRMTPSRGFAIELGAALVIMYGSRQGWPLSTTHCQVGGTMGVGLLEGRAAVNWGVFGKTLLGWVLSILVVGCLTALLVAQGAYAPAAFGTASS